MLPYLVWELHVQAVLTHTAPTSPIALPEMCNCIVLLIYVFLSSSALICASISFIWSKMLCSAGTTVSLNHFGKLG